MIQIVLQQPGAGYGNTELQINWYPIISPTYYISRMEVKQATHRYRRQQHTGPDQHHTQYSGAFYPELDILLVDLDK